MNDFQTALKDVIDVFNSYFPLKLFMLVLVVPSLISHMIKFMVRFVDHREIVKDIPHKTWHY